jgi:ATP-dependent helicase/nuclease subunit B
MSIQFILGRAGTGKTHACIEAIVEDLMTGPEGPPLMLLVPEQATFQAERAVLGDRRIAGYSRFHVVSFDRLQYLLLGRSSARRRLSDVGRQMIVHRILRDLLPHLQAFKSSAVQPGFSRQVAQVLAELHREAHTVQDVNSLIASLDPGGQGRAAALKWQDIRVVLQGYEQALAGRFVDPNVELATVRKALVGAGWLNGARLWVDGFSGFTGAERLILQDLLERVSDAWIAMALDYDDLSASGRGDLSDCTRLFYPAEQTYAILTAGIRDAGMRLKPPILLRDPVRFRASPGLAHMEARLSAPSRRAAMPPGRAAGSVRIWRAPHPRAEVRAAARQILQWVRDGGLRYRDIAIITPDLEAYEHYLRASLADLHIPFFIDRTEPLRHHPLVVLIASALQAAFGGFQTRDVMACLKTGLVPVQPDQVNLLENYCLAFGVNGTDWTRPVPWQFDDPAEPVFDEARINTTRDAALGPLLWLEGQLDKKQALSAGTFAQAVRGLLDRLKTADILQGWIDEACQAGDIGLADEYRQAYAWVGDILDEFVEAFDGQNAGVAEWVSVMGAAMSQATLALIPPTLDQVLVGSSERSRHPDLKAVLLLGATQRQFPTPLSPAGLLTDEDRQTARTAGLSVSGGMQDALAARRYLAYIAFTRPSRYLIVSAPSADERGAALARSSFVDELQRLYEDVGEEILDSEPASLEEVIAQTDLADLLCAKAGTDPLYADMAAQVSADPAFESMAGLLARALGYRDDARLDPRVVASLMAGPLAASATRLSTFAACPYKHFARYLLDLEPRLEFTFEPLDLGDFYHRVLDGLIKTVRGSDLDLAKLDETAVRDLASGIVASTIEGDSFLSHFVRHSRFNEYLLRQAAATAEDACADAARMVRAGDFRPAFSEMQFGRADDPLGAFRLSLSGGRSVSIRGKIDRLDRAAGDGQPVAMVVDYKRKKEQAQLDWTELLDGLDLQLPLYLLAVENARTQGRIDARPAAAFFMRIEAEPAKRQEPGQFLRKAYGIVDGRHACELDRQARKDSAFYNFYVDKQGPYGNYRTRGALKPEHFEAVLRHVEATVRRLADQILSGVITVEPYWLKGRVACQSCDYLPICRFDWQILDYRYPEPVDKLRALERMGGPS